MEQREPFFWEELTIADEDLQPVVLTPKHIVMHSKFLHVGLQSYDMGLSPNIYVGFQILFGVGSRGDDFVVTEQGLRVLRYPIGKDAVEMIHSAVLFAYGLQRNHTEIITHLSIYSRKRRVIDVTSTWYIHFFSSGVWGNTLPDALAPMFRAAGVREYQE